MLAGLFGNSLSFWMGLQSQYDLETARTTGSAGSTKAAGCPDGDSHDLSQGRERRVSHHGGRRADMHKGSRKLDARCPNPGGEQRDIFEALVNAVAHRNYSTAGARIRFHLFRDA